MIVHDKNGNEIKVGDRVKRLSHRNCGIGEGEEFTVVGFDASGWPVADRGVGQMSHNPNYLELVTSAVVLTESELEELVKKANEGLEACKIINTRYKNQVQERNVDLLSKKEHPWQDFDDDGYFVEYRVKPKKFTPFTVGKGWKVELKPGSTDLTIGCRSYYVGDVKKAFTKLCRESGSNHGLFHARRDGITENGEKLTWEEAEKILKALEEVGI